MPHRPIGIGEMDIHLALYALADMLNFALIGVCGHCHGRAPNDFPFAKGQRQNEFIPAVKLLAVPYGKSAGHKRRAR